MCSDCIKETMTFTLTSLRKNLIWAAMVLTLLVYSQAKALTLAEYRARISQASKILSQIQTPEYYSDDFQQRSAFFETSVAEIRLMLPVKETVLHNGQTIEVDNAWLHEALSEYEKNLASPTRSEEIRRNTNERLQALGQRIDETQAAASDKETDKARLAEILRRPEYNKAAAGESAIQRLWERFLRWLAKLFPKIKPMQPGTGRALSGIAQIVVIAISVALIAFLIWKFVPGYLRNRGRKKTKREARIVLGERLEPDQTAADLLEQAEALARTGDLRGAIRKAYIALLCELGDRKVISLAQHKTNRDYLMSVRHRSSLYQSMRGLTRSFELHWYGFVAPAANDWDEFRSGCRSAVATEK
jgi:Domain of unknown function (DUF4129)